MDAGEIAGDHDLPVILNGDCMKATVHAGQPFCERSVERTVRVDARDASAFLAVDTVKAAGDEDLAVILEGDRFDKGNKSLVPRDPRVRKVLRRNPGGRGRDAF